jgi:hypothetical protein
MVTSRSGLTRFALAAALGPPAEPPMMRSFPFFDIFLSSYSSFHLKCFPAGLAYAEYMNGNIIRFEISLFAYLQFENFETAACEINNLPTMLANQMAMILFVGHRFVIETAFFDIEPLNEMELLQKL